MVEESTSKKGEVYSAVVIAAGAAVWLAAAGLLFSGYAWRDQLIVLALVPAAILTGMFPTTFPVPSGLKLTSEKITFTLSDAIVLLVACWYGLPASVFVAGIEGLTSSRRAVRRLSSNFYSFGMMSLASAAASASFSAIMRYGFGESGTGPDQSFPAVAVVLFAASIVHLVVNTGLCSILFAVRLGNSILQSWKENLLWAAPMFLPTSAAASLMYISLQYHTLVMVVVGAPILIAIHLGRRQHRGSVQERLDLIERAQAEREREHRERVELMEKSHRETVEALAVAINAKDEVTHEHVLRVQIYAAGVARLLGCTDAEIEALRAGALLHDIGKIAVPDYILNKPGKLTAAEFDQMKLHTIVGAQILGRVDFPYPVVPVVRHHHERWDGKGYPDGLAGEDIPLTARVLSVVDCFDAVREDRQYRKAMTRDEAINFITGGSGSMYDPRVVGTFVAHLPEFEAEIIARRNAPLPTYGVGPAEQLSAAALAVAPAAGLARDPEAEQKVGAFTPEEQGALRELALAVGAPRGAEESLAAFTRALAALVPFETCAVALVAPETGEVSIAHAAGRHAELLKGRLLAPGEGVTGWVISNRQSFCNTDPKLDLPTPLAEMFADYRTLAVVPVLRGQETLGAIALYSSSLDRYGPAQQRLLEQAATLLASSLPSEEREHTTAPPAVVPVGGPPRIHLSSQLTH